MHGAGTALGDAAAELGAGEAEQVAQHPEQGHVGWRVYFTLGAVIVSFMVSPGGSTPEREAAGEDV